MWWSVGLGVSRRSWVYLEKRTLNLKEHIILKFSEPMAETKIKISNFIQLVACFCFWLYAYFRNRCCNLYCQYLTIVVITEHEERHWTTKQNFWDGKMGIWMKKGANELTRTTAAVIVCIIRDCFFTNTTLFTHSMSALSLRDSSGP